MATDAGEESAESVALSYLRPAVVRCPDAAFDTDRQKGAGLENQEAVARARLAPPVASLSPVGPYQSMQTTVASS